MLSPTPLTLRTIPLTTRLQPMLLKPLSRTAIAPFVSQCLSKSTLSRPQLAPSSFPSLHHAYTTTAPAIPTSQSNTSSSSSSLTTPLTWNAFLHLRKIRRRFNTLSSLLTSTSTTVAGIALLSTQDLDSLGQLLFGLDPLMAMGLGVAGCGAVGWLLGPFAGEAAFRTRYRRLGGEIAMKEKEFYQCIKAHRADPSSQSMANPVPDYYGEKIDSVRAYRQWLKDQRAFTKKRQSF